MSPLLSSVCISVVSHAQGDLIRTLLLSLESHCTNTATSVVLTYNTNEPFTHQNLNLSFPVTVINNSEPKGFGANHNTAFSQHCESDFFCVLNPDILLLSDPFPNLLRILDNREIGVISPTLTDSKGQQQDNAREFPTLMRILQRVCYQTQKYYNNMEERLFFPDWVAGMFMLFPAPIFSSLQGFNENYFMYCEDADICLRLQQKNLKTACTTTVTAIHDPRRSSHRNIQHFYWHMQSLLRFFAVYLRSRRPHM